MMTQKFHLILILSTLAVFLIMFRMVIKGKLQLRYTLAWIGCGMILIAASVEPQIITNISKLLGIYDDTNTVFLMMNFLLFMLSLVFTISTSRNNDRVVMLAQELGILKNTVGKLQSQVERGANDGASKENIS